GILLTPVFFYVIEGFIEVPLFSSPRARQLSRGLRLMAAVLTLGLPWLPRLLTRRRVAVQPEAAGANGVVARSEEAVKAASGEKAVIDVVKLLPGGDGAHDGNEDKAAAPAGQPQPTNGEARREDASPDQVVHK